MKIERVVESFECGAIVNQLHLHNQVEGAVVQAIGGAMFESIQFKNGQILNGKFSQYRLPRFSDVPVIEVVLLDRKDVRQRVQVKRPSSASRPLLRTRYLI